MTPENWRFSSAADEAAMEGIAITHDAYAAIAAALPQGVDARRVDPAAKKVFVWLDGSLADCLAALRRPGEDHSDVILRLAAIEQEEAWHAPSDRKGKLFCIGIRPRAGDFGTGNRRSGAASDREVARRTPVAPDREG